MTSPSEADAAAGGQQEEHQQVVVVVANKHQQSSQERLMLMMTKRQRRALKNPKHAWPQHPRIRNPQQRQAAYIRAAGLVQSKKKKKKQEQELLNINDDDTSSSAANNPFGKKLGSADARVRHQTVLQLEAYLKARSDISSSSTSETGIAGIGGGISELELLKLWKCLWYTLYMADRVPVQNELSWRLAQLLFCVAGTPPQDEYAAAAYLREQAAANDDLLLLEDDKEEKEELWNNSESEESESDDENEVLMEEIENTLNRLQGRENEEGSDGDNSEDEEEESEVDDVEKQQALLQEAEHEDDEDDDDDDDDDKETAASLTMGHCRGAHLAALVVRTFFRTILREWDRMDKYRVDKFYVAMRYMMRAVYQYMANRQWNIGIIRLFNDGLYEEVLCTTPNGVRYHLMDVCLAELCAVCNNKHRDGDDGSAMLPMTEAIFLDVLEPFFAMAQTGAGNDDTVQSRVVDRVLEQFLDEYSVVSEKYLTYIQNKNKNNNDNNVEPPLVFDQVHVGTVSQFIFEIASDGASKDSYRKRLYDMHKRYERRIQQVGGPKHDVQTNTTGTNDNDDDHHHHHQDKNNEQDDDGSLDSEEDDDADSSSSSEDDGAPEKVVAKRKQDDNDDDGISSSSEEFKTPPKSVPRRKGKPPTPFPKGGKAVSKTDVDPSKLAGKKQKKTKAKEKPLPEAKKTAKPSKASDRSPPMQQEEEITISIAEQKAAKKALKKRQKQQQQQQEEEKRASDSAKMTSHTKRKRQQGTTHHQRNDNAEDTTTTTSSGSKRVKFRDTNKTRSWTASMKNLRTKEIHISGHTPERSILLNKDQKPKIKSHEAKSKASRKKASDYFKF